MMAKARIENMVFNVPTRKRTFILRLNRNMLHLSKDDIYVSVDDENRIVEHLVKGYAHKGNKLLTISGLVCDSCGDPVFKQYVDILIIDGYGWGLICDKCREKYHNKLPIFVVKN